MDREGNGRSCRQAGIALRVCRCLVRQLGKPALLAATYKGNAAGIAAAAMEEVEATLVNCLHELDRLSMMTGGRVLHSGSDPEGWAQTKPSGTPPAKFSPSPSCSDQCLKPLVVQPSRKSVYLPSGKGSRKFEGWFREQSASPSKRTGRTSSSAFCRHCLWPPPRTRPELPSLSRQPAQA